MWQDNTNPCAEATTPSSDGGGEMQEKPSARHRAKGTALDAAAMQVMGFAVGDTAPQFLGHEGRGIKSLFTAVPPGLQEKKVWVVQFQRLKKKIQSEKSSGFTEIIPE